MTEEPERPPATAWLARNAVQLVMASLLGVLSFVGTEVLAEVRAMRAEQAEVATFALVPDLDMAGARGAAISARETLPR